MKEENVKELFSTRFIKVYDLQYEEGAHYYDASRRPLKDLAALKSGEEFLSMLPDAVSCIVILKTPGEEPRLVMSYEYRYPVGQYLLSPAAGLLDPEDLRSASPQITAAKREISEEMGFRFTDSDRVETVAPCLFSTPGMTDESNALVLAYLERPDLSELSQKGAVGSERFDGFCLLTRGEAEAVLRKGRDSGGRFYSMFTWGILLYFVSGMWE